jgi:hypothetical protein
MRFVKGRKPMNNIFLIKTTIDKYLRFKRGRISWRFLYLQKDFYPIEREFLRFNRRRKGISDTTVNCIKKIYNGITFCVKYGQEEGTNCVEQGRGVRQGCSFSPCSFSFFINDITDHINKGNLHATTTGKKTVPGLLHAHDLAVSPFTIKGLQKSNTSSCKIF